MDTSLFASRTVTRHLLRGVLGAGLFAVAMAAAAPHPALALAAAAGGIAALRGCPMCWTVGLCETVVHRVRHR